jgi:hypothetical protein
MFCVVAMAAAFLLGALSVFTVVVLLSFFEE